MAELSVEMRVNGRKVTRQAKAHWRLLDFLREELHLTGSKEGCGAGECGTCSVFVDGKLIKSCLLPLAKAQGADIQTVEGLSDADELTPIQRAFYKTGASQNVWFLQRQSDETTYLVQRRAINVLWRALAPPK